MWGLGRLPLRQSELSAFEGLGPFPLPVGMAPSSVILFQLVEQHGSDRFLLYL